MTSLVSSLSAFANPTATTQYPPALVSSPVRPQPPPSSILLPHRLKPLPAVNPSRSFLSRRVKLHHKPQSPTLSLRTTVARREHHHHQNANQAFHRPPPSHPSPLTVATHDGAVSLLHSRLPPFLSVRVFLSLPFACLSLLRETSLISAPASSLPLPCSSSLFLPLTSLHSHVISLSLSFPASAAQLGVKIRVRGKRGIRGAG